MATAQSTPMTVDEWALLPEDDDRELVDGFLEESEVAGFGHGHLVALLTARLLEHFRPRGGWVTGDGVKVALTERKGRIPDAAVFLQRPAMKGAVRVAPAIVVEVLSEGAANHRRDRVAKLDEYAARGICQYWLVDPDAHTVEIFALQGGLYARVAAGTEGPLSIPDHPGLTLDLDDLFADVD